MPMASSKDKSIMRNLGEFFGHIIKGVKTDTGKPKNAKPPETVEVRREVEEIEQDNMILRRTTIDEVEFKSDDNTDQKTDN